MSTQSNRAPTRRPARALEIGIVAQRGHVSALVLGSSTQMILVITGAGASYDSVAFRPPTDWGRDKLPQRPPLAQELFLYNPVVNKTLKSYPQFNAIVHHLQKPPGNSTLENVLEGLQSEAETDPVRKRQLMAVRFYLQAAILNFEHNWSRVHDKRTNHVMLLDQLRRKAEI